MANALIDNSEQYKLVTYIKELVAKPNCNHIMIATGYWDLPGTALIFNELKVFFERGGHLELLIGEEPHLQYYQVNEDVKKFPDFYIQRDINHLTDEYLPIGQLINTYAKTDENPDGLFEIRVYGQGEHKEFLHAKCYIFEGRQLGTGIVGSSNFTQKGLEGNAELNYLEENSNAVTADFNENSTSKSHKAWFKERWRFSEPWTGKFIKDILLKSPLGPKIKPEPELLVPTVDVEPLTPYELYIKYLQMQFGDIVDARTTTILKTYLPEKFNSYEYQLDAVKQCFTIMKLYGGFILGDVVGLGKTVVGLLLIRHFLEQAESLNRPRKVLIVTPPSIKAGWVKTIKQFDSNHLNQIEPCVSFVTTGSIGNLLDEGDIDADGEGESETLGAPIPADNYGLIIIDESHNFRNDGTQKYKALDDLIGILNPTPYVALLSATPQNNSPKDLYNQIKLFQREPNNSNLPGVQGGKMGTLFTEMEKRFKEARAIPQDTEEGREAARKIIAEVSEQIRKAVLNDLVVRRTRTDIKKHYDADSADLNFPSIVGPRKLEYHMDEDMQKLFFDTIQAICPPANGEPYDPNKHIGFFRYAAITQFVDPKNTELYEVRNLTVEGTTRSLQRIMRMLLVKRLESSKAAFEKSLANLGRYNEVMVDMLGHDCVYICPDFDVNKIHAESDGDFAAFQEAVEKMIAKKKGNNRRFRAADFNPQYIEDLRRDGRLISRLLRRWRESDSDPKFDFFKGALEPKLFDPAINNPSGVNRPRLVIFTEALDTQESIVRFLRAKGHKVLKVSAKNRTDCQEAIERNFDANCEPERQLDQYDTIVTTEVLAEGVNLHRANVILNYDAPWNATRLMQRIGRVNRIGSVEKEVHVFNFFPSDEGNSQIRLVEKAYAKLQSFHEMFGEDSKIFSEREELVELDHDLTRMFNGEESPFGVFIKELKTYRADNPDRYEYITSIEPNGIGGAVASPDGTDKSLFIFTDNSQGFISVEVTPQEETKASVISTLATLEFLKCNPDATFTPAEASDDKTLQDATRAYKSHVAHYMLASDSSKNQKKALKILGDLRKRSDISDDSKAILKAVERQVRGKDNYLIKAVMRFENIEPTLFGLDYDINSLIETSFAHTAAKATERRGEGHVALFETHHP